MPCSAYQFRRRCRQSDVLVTLVCDNTGIFGRWPVARVAFVTGGTRGIGRAICERLASDGMKVAAGYSGNEDAAVSCAKDIGVMVVKGNVGNFEDCKSAVAAVTAELGPVDVLVNN